MKKFSSFLVVIFLVLACASFQPVVAQEKTQKEQEKDAKIQKAIDEQKKALADQKKAQEEAQQNVFENQVDIEKTMDEANIAIENANRDREKIYMAMPRRNRSYNFSEPFVLSGDNMLDYYGHSMGDSERTTWDFSKTIKDNTFSRDYTFDVEKTIKSVVMSVMGDCKSGEIRIKIVMPNGKNYSDILIDESGNLNWRKSFSISETENQDKTGDWKFQISSSKATGFFKISLQAF